MTLLQELQKRSKVSEIDIVTILNELVNMSEKYETELLELISKINLQWEKK